MIVVRTTVAHVLHSQQKVLDRIWVGGSWSATSRGSEGSGFVSQYFNAVLVLLSKNDSISNEFINVKSAHLGQITILMI